MTTAPRPRDGDAAQVHWLYRPGAKRVFWTAALVLLAATLLAEVFIHPHSGFARANWFGFNAAYGFLACVAMVLFARVLGWLVKRRDDYYQREPRE